MKGIRYKMNETDKFISEEIRALFSVKLARYRVDFVYAEAVSRLDLLPRIRGQLGFQLKKQNCPHPDFRKRPCEDCILIPECPYIRLFSPISDEPNITADGQIKQTPSPVRPFVIDFAGANEGFALPGQTGSVQFTLLGPAIGEARRFLGATLAAMEVLPLDVTQVGWAMPKTVPTSESVPNESAFYLWQWLEGRHHRSMMENAGKESTWRLIMQSPARLVKSGKNLKKTPDFIDLVKGMIRRLRDLKRAYGNDADMGRPSAEFYNFANSVKCIENKLEWIQHKRYSHKQERDIMLDGFMGEMTFSGRLRPFLPLILAGEIIHLGKGVTCGNGKIIFLPE